MRPNNKELSRLENFLDNEVQIFDGSDFYKTLESIFEYLDEVISELKDQINGLESDKEDLETRLEELE
jgi:chaperonin cofactor prefoldin